MSYRAHNIDKNVLAGFYMNSEQETRRQYGIPSGTTVFNQGWAEFTTDGKITFSNPVYGVKSIRLIVDLDTITEDILNLSSSHSIEVGTGTVTATGVSSPTIYVDGVAGSTITTSKVEIVITTATGFTSDDIIAGYISSYLEGKIELIEFWNVELTSESISNLYNNARYKEPQLDTADHQRILHVTAKDGVILDRFGATITNTDTEVFKDGSVRVMDFNGVSSFVNFGNIDIGSSHSIMWWGIINSDGGFIGDDARWEYPARHFSGSLRYQDVSGNYELYVIGFSPVYRHFCLVRNGSDLKLYVDGTEVSSAATSGTLGDISINCVGKTNTVEAKTKMSEVIVIDGILTSNEVSQYVSSTKHLYSK